ncbi:type I restriction-modification system subunit M [Gimesia maris]|uniref:type I restriction-modification system subunit M n=1 Tax=Gimesia maris TaxID=122 RepID=UPI003A90FB2E
MTNFSQTAAYIWSLADLLRGDFKQSQYGRVILPFTILRRLECVLETTKPKVLTQVEKLKGMTALEEEAREKFLIKAAKQSFYNTSPMDLSKLGSADIKTNLLSYVDSFSRDAREIFEHFKFAEFIAQLQDANLLYKVVQKVALTDLSPQAISNHEMGLVFEELIRRFAESSNETAGEHFTPRDIVRLTTSLVFMEDDDALTEPGIIRTIYDPTAGTGGFLSSGMEYVHELNPEAVVRAFGQELNPESYAICKGDMLIKGQDVSRIKLGNTLSDDQLYADRFDYMLSNPPFGVDWKKVEGTIKDEHKVKGFDGRFGPGLPRVSDGSLLFLMHLISKMRDYDPNDPNKNGGRIGIILNGSPLFTGGAGSGESEIRRYILESDLLEAIVALPTDMFYNTGIATYVWILSNKKEDQRKGKVQLINGVHLYQKMRKSLGSKRQEIGEEDVRLITRTFGDFEAIESYSLDKDPDQKSNLAAAARGRGRQSSSKKKAAKKTFGSKIFASHEFGYRRITIERPLRLSVQFSDERIETLRFEPGKLSAAMQAVWERFLNQPHGVSRSSKSPGATEPGLTPKRLVELEPDIRAMVKADFADLKERQIKDLLAVKTWTDQKELLDIAIKLQAVIGTDQHDDFNQFEETLKAAIKVAEVELDVRQKKQIIAAVSWTNPEAQPVIKKVLKKGKADPTYGTFEYQGQIVQFQPDSDLRDNEDVPLTAETARGANVDAVNEAYFLDEVAPHVPDAWIDGGKRDAKDDGIGIVGYEIPFNRHFYEYQPQRPLQEIDAELDELSAEIMQILQEVHS